MKAVIVGGAGGIGSSAAFNLLSARGAYEIVLVDTRPNMITRHTADNARIVEERLYPVREAGADFRGLRRTAMSWREVTVPYPPCPASVSRTSATGTGSRGPMCDAPGKSCTRKGLPGVTASASAIILSWSAVAIVRSLPKRR